MNNKISYYEKHSLGYIPFTLLKAVLDEVILKDEKLPATFSFNSVSLIVNVEVNIVHKTKEISSDQNISEYIHFCLSRYFEQIISIISSNGGDILKLEIDSIFAVWHCSGFNESNDNINLSDCKPRTIQSIVKCLQAALEIKKRLKIIVKVNNLDIKVTLGIGFGNTMVIILGGFLNKYKYVTVGEAVTSAFGNRKESEKNGNNIVISKKMYDMVQNLINVKEEDVYKKYYEVIGIKGSLENSETIRPNKSDFSQEKLLSKCDLIRRFNSNILISLVKQNIIHEKWLKEVRSLTVMSVKLRMPLDELNSPEHLQKIVLLVQSVSAPFNGVMDRISLLDDGLLFQLIWGVPPRVSTHNAVYAVLDSFSLYEGIANMGYKLSLGIASGIAYFGVFGNLAGRREVKVVGSIVERAGICADVAEGTHGLMYKILLDSNTNHLINGTLINIPVNTNTNESIYFTPINIVSNKKLRRTSTEELKSVKVKNINLMDSNAFLKILFHDIEPKNCPEFTKENLNSAEDIKELIKSFTEGNRKIKLISINGFVGTNKRMVLQKGLYEYLKSNKKLNNLVFHKETELSFPFIFSINVFLANYIKGDTAYEGTEFKAIQFMLRNMSQILWQSDETAQLMIRKIKENQCTAYVKFLEKFLDIPGLVDNYEENEYHKSDEITIEAKPMLNGLFMSLISLYKDYINSDILNDKGIDIPLILLIKHVELLDEDSLEFLKQYVESKYEDMLVITLNSIPLYPAYYLLDEEIKNPFHDIRANQRLKTVRIEPLYTRPDTIEYIKNCLSNKRNENINKVSEKLVDLLLTKTFGGIPLLLHFLLLSLYDSKLLLISTNDRVLHLSSRLEDMIRYDSFIELKLPPIIEKLIGTIIDKNLSFEEKRLMKIASMLGNLFDSDCLKQILKIDASNEGTRSHDRDPVEYNVQGELGAICEKGLIEVLYDLDPRGKFIVYKFALPFMREVIYKRMPVDHRGQLHLTIGKMIKLSAGRKGIKYYDDEASIGKLERHLKLSEISIHEGFNNLIYLQLNNEGNKEDKVKEKNYDIDSESNNNNDNNMTNYDLTSLLLNKELNLSNLCTLTIQKLCAKISQIKLNDDKSNMIKKGYISKKSDGKITWENRFFVLTTKRMVYYYNENDYLDQNVEPLGIFYLKNLFEVHKYNDGVIGGKRNVFSLNVNEWIKKGNVMSKRIYYLSTKDRNDMYKWVVTFNILKMKAFYENYCFYFGHISFPLYKDYKNFNIQNRKIKKEKFNLPEDKIDSMRKLSVEMLRRQRFRKKSTKRLTIFSPYFLLGNAEISLYDWETSMFKVKYFLLITKYLLPLLRLLFVANIQFKIANNFSDSNVKYKYNQEHFGSYDLYDMYSPSHITLIFSKEFKENYRKHTANLNSVKHNLVSHQEHSNSFSIAPSKIICTEQQNEYIKEVYPLLNTKYKNERVSVIISPKKADASLVRKSFNQYEDEDSNESFKKKEDENKDVNDDFLRYTDYINETENMDKQNSITSSNVGMFGRTSFTQQFNNYKFSNQANNFNLVTNKIAGTSIFRTLEESNLEQERNKESSNKVNSPIKKRISTELLKESMFHDGSKIDTSSDFLSGMNVSELMGSPRASIVENQKITTFENINKMTLGGSKKVNSSSMESNENKEDTKSKNNEFKEKTSGDSSSRGSMEEAIMSMNSKNIDSQKDSQSQENIKFLALDEDKPRASKFLSNNKMGNLPLFRRGSAVMVSKKSINSALGPKKTAEKIGGEDFAALLRSCSVEKGKNAEDNKENNNNDDSSKNKKFFDNKPKQINIAVRRISSVNNNLKFLKGLTPSDSSTSNNKNFKRQSSHSQTTITSKMNYLNFVNNNNSNKNQENSINVSNKSNSNGVLSIADINNSNKEKLSKNSNNKRGYTYVFTFDGNDEDNHTGDTGKFDSKNNSNSNKNKGSSNKDIYFNNKDNSNKESNNSNTIKDYKGNKGEGLIKLKIENQKEDKIKFESKQSLIKEEENSRKVELLLSGRDNNQCNKYGVPTINHFISNEGQNSTEKKNRIKQMVRQRGSAIFCPTKNTGLIISNDFHKCHTMKTKGDSNLNFEESDSDNNDNINYIDENKGNSINNVNKNGNNINNDIGNDKSTKNNSKKLFSGNINKYNNEYADNNNRNKIETKNDDIVLGIYNKSNINDNYNEKSNLRYNENSSRKNMVNSYSNLNTLRSNRNEQNNNREINSNNVNSFSSLSESTTKDKTDITSDLSSRLMNLNLSNKAEENYIEKIKNLTIQTKRKLYEQKQTINNSFYSYDLSSISTKSNGDVFSYPNVFYINNNDQLHLHSKTHVSNLFSNLKKASHN